MKRKNLIYIGLAVIVAFAAGFWMRGPGRAHDDHARSEAAKDAGDAVEFWTCSMHPQINQPKPGKCPICGMDLIPVSKGNEGEAGPRELTLSPRARKLAEIQTSPVERKHVTAEIRMVGKVKYDETKVASITAWVPGRLDRLYVDYTGVPVKKGDHLVYLYSPELLQAQEELISSMETSSELRESKSAYLRGRAEETIGSAREKLRLWGLGEDQIREVEQRGKPSDHITINSPIEGIVVHKNAVEGMYVDTGTRIYTVADLSEVWVMLDAYESDLPWLHYGQEAEFRTEAYPGEVFKGRIAFIDPTLNAKTRTVNIRVNLPNPDGKLKPDMFVRAVVKSNVAKGGQVMDPDLAGKWISPMHPEIVKDAPGQCDICGMDLVSAESLGYAAVEKDTAPLVIPSSAPLITGKRAVVYVEKAPGQYEGREIELGARAGDYYLVNAGLTEGERVVTKGNFKIDSAVQILAKPSMMNPEGGGPAPGHDHGTPEPGAGSDGHEGREQSQTIRTFETPAEFKQQLGDAIGPYLELHAALSRDDLSAAKDATAPILAKLKAIDMGLLQGEAHMAWMERLKTIQSGVEAIAKEEGLAEARGAFKQVSDALIQSVKQFDAAGESRWFVYHCPMAFGGQGADWLQNKEGVENPYYGSQMFTCGNLKESLSASSAHEGHMHE